MNDMQPSPTPSPTAAPSETPTPTTTSTVHPTPTVVPPSTTQPTNWDTIIGVLALLIAMASFAVGLRRPDLSRFWKTFLYVLEVLALLASITVLGWLGLGLFVLGLALTGVVHSVRLAMKLDSILTGAAIEGNTDRDEMRQLHKSTHRSHKALQWLGPIETGNLVRLLAQRGRNPQEIRTMMVPLAMLFAAFEPGPMESLVERFDRLLRLAGKPADEAMAIADTLTASTQQSAVSFNEMLDAMIAFYDHVGLPDSDEKQ